MTVAAGFVCSDGIILCADSEHSDEITKFQRSKVFRFGDDLVLTGAGQTSYITTAFDKLSDKYRQGIPDTPSGARLALEEVILDVYANHIAPFFEVNSRPYFPLLTATRCVSAASNSDLPNKPSMSCTTLPSAPARNKNGSPSRW